MQKSMGIDSIVLVREASKANWVRSCRVLRPLLLEFGDRLVARGLIEGRDDVFWLMDEEVGLAIEGKLDQQTARAGRRPCATGPSLASRPGARGG